MANNTNGLVGFWIRGAYEAIRSWRRGFIRNSGAGELIELFLVASICSVLGIRGFLAAAGYPQLGGDGLHIAHMLWGGGFMLVAMILLFAFMGQSLDRLAAVLGGVGFGTFIDELGKFITSDNNYFYQPTIGLIYIIFISIFLVLRAVRRTRTLGPTEALANALNLIQASIATPMDPEKKSQILAMLDQTDPADPLAPHLRAYVDGVESSPDDPAHFYFRIKERMISIYQRVVRQRAFSALFPALILLWGISQAAALGYLVYGLAGERAIVDISWTHYAQAVSLAATILCIAIGIWAWPSRRDRSYRWYMRGALVSIFITQVFIFFHSQLAAISGLTANVITYAVLDFAAKLDAEARSSMATGG